MQTCKQASIELCQQNSCHTQNKERAYTPPYPREARLRHWSELVTALVAIRFLEGEHHPFVASNTNHTTSRLGGVRKQFDRRLRSTHCHSRQSFTAFRTTRWTMLSTARLVLLLGAFLAVSAQPSITQSTSSEEGEDLLANCDLSTYLLSFQHELDNGLLESEARCDEATREVGARRFGPPSQFDQFEATCKGACHDYGMRVIRLKQHGGEGCDCKVLQRLGYFTYSCRTPSEYLCRRTGYCYDFEEYFAETCAPDACGRWEPAEAEWRLARLACGSTGITVSTAAMLLATLFSSWFAAD